MLRITVELLPHGDESRAETIATARICNLRHHPAGSEVGDYHAFFEANEVPDDEARGAIKRPAFEDKLRRTDHLVASTYANEVPRFKGSVWDLVAIMLDAGGRGWAKIG